jgi:hypothetical protein
VSGNEFGRRVFEPQNGDQRIEALRSVLSTREPAKIDGVFVEYHWARMILDLYDEVGPEARQALADTPVPHVPRLIESWAKGQTRGS